jgi:hypothetical protein
MIALVDGLHSYFTFGLVAKWPEKCLVVEGSKKIEKLIKLEKTIEKIKL